MRTFARIGITLGILALAQAAPATAFAQSQPAPAKPWMPIFHRHAKKTAAKPSHLCNDCQRALVKKRDGVDIPPVPPMPIGMMVDTGPCTKCKHPVMVVREDVAPGKLFAVRPSPGAPVGLAVASDEPMMGQSTLVSAEPFPIGVYNQKGATSAPVAPSSAPAMAMSGSRDASVTATSASMPASDPVKPPGHNRPHILFHLFGLSDFGREGAEIRERREREDHASIQYGPQAQGVSELPSKMVYSKDDK